MLIEADRGGSDEVIVFLGPTLPRDEAARLLSARYLPPVQQGALLEVAAREPQAIVVIDGFFSWVPSVWHKEILWALDRGISVFGASSMGALRAAELHSFGMVGYGQVFEAYRDGVLVDDDEVAILHSDAEHGFRPLTDAMVNVRSTLVAAVEHGVLDAVSAARLTSACKEQHFRERSLMHLARRAVADGLVDECAGHMLLDWLPDNVRDVKREDASELLGLLATGWRGDSSAVASFVFQETTNWLRLKASVRTVSVRQADAVTCSSPVGDDDVLAECRVAGRWPEVEAAALARLLVVDAATGFETLDDDEVLTELARLCLRLGVDNLDDLLVRCAPGDWDWDDLLRAVGASALLARVREERRGDLADSAIDVLVLTDRAEELAERAAHKRRWLAERPSAIAVRDDPSDAITWFRCRVGAHPKAPDAVVAREHGWRSTSDMAEDLLREHAYLHRDGDGQERVHSIPPRVDG